MASTISAGTTSGTAIAISGDTSGSLQLQTNGTTTAVTLDTSQNATFAGKVTSAGALTLASNGTTTAVTIDTSQNVGIGTTSPVTKLNIVDALAGGQLLVANNQTDATEKYGTFGTQHYTNAEEPALGMAVQSNATDNTILIGGALGEFNAATQVRFYTAANNTTVTGTERMRIDSSGNLQFNSGYGSVATAYGCRAWVNFNGTGTVAIRASGNVSSITDNGTGDYTVNFTTALVDGNYSWSGVAGKTAGKNTYVQPFPDTTPTITTSNFRMAVLNSSAGVVSDEPLILLSVFR